MSNSTHLRRHGSRTCQALFYTSMARTGTWRRTMMAGRVEHRHVILVGFACCMHKLGICVGLSPYACTHLIKHGVCMCSVTMQSDARAQMPGWGLIACAVTIFVQQYEATGTCKQARLLTTSIMHACLVRRACIQGLLQLPAPCHHLQQSLQPLASGRLSHASCAMPPSSRTRSMLCTCHQQCTKRQLRNRML